MTQRCSHTVLQHCWNQHLPRLNDEKKKLEKKSLIIVVAVKDIVQSAEHHSKINPDTCLLRIHIYIPAEKDQLWPQSIPMLVQACLEIRNSLKVTAVIYVTEAGDGDVCGNTDGWKVTASAMGYRQLSLMTLFFFLTLDVIMHLGPLDTNDGPFPLGRNPGELLWSPIALSPLYSVPPSSWSQK